MHDDETIGMHAPFWAFSGAHRPVEESTVDGGSGRKTNSAGGSIKNSSEAGAAGGGGSAAAAAPGKSSSINNSSGRDVVVGGHEGDIADNVDGFLDEFMVLAGGNDDGNDYGMMSEEGGGGDPAISEEDLVFLADMDLADFLPPAITAEEGDALLSPSSVHEMETLPSQGGRVASPVMTAAAEATLGPAAAAAGGVGVIASPAAATAVAPGVETDGRGAARTTGNSNNQHANAAAVTDCGGGGGGSDASAAISPKEQVRRQKVARYLAKKQRRCWSKPAASSYQSRQRVANSRPRHKGRFLPLESEFVPIAELQRRQRALMVQMREKAAASAATAAASAATASAATASAALGTADVGAFGAGVPLFRV